MCVSLFVNILFEDRVDIVTRIPRLHPVFLPVSIGAISQNASPECEPVPNPDPGPTHHNALLYARKFVRGQGSERRRSRPQPNARSHGDFKVFLFRGSKLSWSATRRMAGLVGRRAGVARPWADQNGGTGFHPRLWLRRVCGQDCEIAGNSGSGAKLVQYFVLN